MAMIATERSSFTYNQGLDCGCQPSCLARSFDPDRWPEPSQIYNYIKKRSFTPRTNTASCVGYVDQLFLARQVAFKLYPLTVKACMAEASEYLNNVLTGVTTRTAPHQRAPLDTDTHIHTYIHTYKHMLSDNAAELDVLR